MLKTVIPFFGLFIFFPISLQAQDEKLVIEGAIIVANNDDPIPSPGTIRWNGSHFEGWNGNNWVLLDFSTLDEVDGDPTNELQDLVLTNDSLSLTNSLLSVDMNPFLQDSSDTNELQFLSISSDTIFLSDGGHVIIPSGNSSGHYIGELFGGGIVFAVWNDGNNGLIASLDNLSGDVEWGGIGTDVPNLGNGDRTEYYDGLSNTTKIVSAVGNNGGTPYAAKLCDDYSFDGYNDWYLPSIWELNHLYIAAPILSKILDSDGDNMTNGFLADNNATFYWSSTEHTAPAFAIYYRFHFAGTNLTSKDQLGAVRAIRQF